MPWDYPARVRSVAQGPIRHGLFLPDWLYFVLHKHVLHKHGAKIAPSSRIYLDS